MTSTSVVIHFTSYNSFRLNGSPTYAYSRTNFFFDLDRNPATGYSVSSGSIGSELLLQATGLYRESAGVFNAGFLGSATSSATSGSEYTLTVPLSIIRSIAHTATSIRIVGLNDETHQYIPPSGAWLTVTLA